MILSEYEARTLITDLSDLVEDGHTVSLSKDRDGTYVATISGVHYTADSLKLAIFRVFAHVGKHHPEDHYPFQLPRSDPFAPDGQQGVLW
jgi:hypothetical protein